MALTSRDARLVSSTCHSASRVLPCETPERLKREASGPIMLRIDIKSHNGTAILHCSGRIVFGVEAETLRSVTRFRHERALQIDLAEVETVDASGLGLLVELQHWALREGRAVRFVNPSDFVARLIMLTRLHPVLGIPLTSGYDRCGLESALIA